MWGAHSALALKRMIAEHEGLQPIGIGMALFDLGTKWSLLLYELVEMPITAVPDHPCARVQA